MEEKLPRFYRYMFPGFETKLRLPNLVSKKVVEHEVEEVVLTSQKGSWVVKIHDSLDGKIWLTKRWDDFVQKHDIRLGDFAVFEHTGMSGSLCFNVMLFDGTCCERDFHDKRGRTQGNPYVKVEIDLDEGPPPVKIQKNSSTHDKRAKRKRVPKAVEQHPQLVTTMKEYNIRGRSPYFHIPADFCKANGVYYDERFKEVILKGPMAEQKVSIEVCNGGNTIYAIISTGWINFIKANNLKLGDTCILQFRCR